MKIANHGDPKSPIWLIMEQPYTQDQDKGYILSGGYGYMFKKVWNLSGISIDPYIYVMKPCLGATYDDNVKFSELITDLSSNSVPFILPTSLSVFERLCPDLVSKSQKKAIFKKYTGSLLSCQYLNYPHYVIPLYPPDYITANWDYHEVMAFIDLGHVKEEYEYYVANSTVQPLLARQLVTNPSYEDLLAYFYKCRYDYDNSTIRFISNDIETIRPAKNTPLHKRGHPGYPYCVSIAISPIDGISFSLWDYPANLLAKIWREYDALLRDIPQIGQNYFAFDSHWLEALGFRLCLSRCQDTLIRHHILWPSLEHKLQFQTKQYTRQPFYKDEGKQWSTRNKAPLMHYNALDSTVTLEIFLAQELEFNERQYLK